MTTKKMHVEDMCEEGQRLWRDVVKSYNECRKHLSECNKCQEGLEFFMDVHVEELCKEGQRLWDAINTHKPNSYDNYRRHIVQCKKCQEDIEREVYQLYSIKDDIKIGSTR